LNYAIVQKTYSIGPSKEKISCICNYPPLFETLGSITQPLKKRRVIENSQLEDAAVPEYFGIGLLNILVWADSAGIGDRRVT